MGVLNTLIHRVQKIADADNISMELSYLETVFRSNGYSSQQIKTVMRKYKNRNHTTRENTTAEKETVALIPYMRKTSNQLATLLRKDNIRTIHCPPPKIKNLLPTLKDAL